MAFSLETYINPAASGLPPPQDVAGVAPNNWWMVPVVMVSEVIPESMQRQSLRLPNALQDAKNPSSYLLLLVAGRLPVGHYPQQDSIRVAVLVVVVASVLVGVKHMQVP